MAFSDAASVSVSVSSAAPVLVSISGLSSRAALSSFCLCLSRSFRLCLGFSFGRCLCLNLGCSLQSVLFSLSQCSCLSIRSLPGMRFPAELQVILSSSFRYILSNLFSTAFIPSNKSFDPEFFSSHFHSETHYLSSISHLYHFATRKLIIFRTFLCSQSSNFCCAFPERMLKYSAIVRFRPPDSVRPRCRTMQ